MDSFVQKTLDEVNGEAENKRGDEDQTAKAGIGKNGTSQEQKHEQTQQDLLKR